MSDYLPCRRELRILVLFLLFFLLGDGAAAGLDWQKTRPELLRLHIVAASDAPAHQAIKLAVRDAVLETYGHVFAQSVSQSHAESQAQTLLPAIENTASKTLRQAGFANDHASAQITERFFPTRRYGNVVLPAGTYRSLQITLGEGVGQNWWCVLYPPLCLSAAAFEEQAPENPEMSTETIVENGSATKKSRDENVPEASVLGDAPSLTPSKENRLQFGEKAEGETLLEQTGPILENRTLDRSSTSVENTGLQPRLLIVDVVERLLYQWQEK